MRIVEVRQKIRSRERETFVVDEAVAVDVRLANHLVDFIIGQLLAECQHHLP